LRLSAAGATIIALLTQYLHPEPLVTELVRFKNNDDDNIHEKKKNKSKQQQQHQPYNGSSGESNQTYVINMNSMCIWFMISLLILLTSTWVIYASRDYALYGDNHSSNSGIFPLFIVVINKWSITYAKTSLFILFHPEKRSSVSSATRATVKKKSSHRFLWYDAKNEVGLDVNTSSLMSPPPMSPPMLRDDDDQYFINNELESDNNNNNSSGTVDIVVADDDEFGMINGKKKEEEYDDDEADDVLRWGGAGIQVGGLFGSLTFFLCTVSFKVL
jgi:hypothetical protein